MTKLRSQSYQLLPLLPHLLQPPDLLLLLPKAKPSLFMFHLQLLPPLGHLPHVLKDKTWSQGQSPHSAIPTEHLR